MVHQNSAKKQAEVANEQPLSSANSLDDRFKEVILMPRELEQFWPSLLPSTQGEPTAFGQDRGAMSPEEFNGSIDEMKSFMNLVIKIAFGHLHHDSRNPANKALYDGFFTKKSAHDSSDFDQKELGRRIETYVSSVLEQDNLGPELGKGNTEEQQEQMNFSALVVLFRVLKTIRMQDSLGPRPQ